MKIGELYNLREATKHIASCDRMAATGNKNFRIGYVHFINCLRPIILDGKLHPLRSYNERNITLCEN